MALTGSTVKISASPRLAVQYKSGFSGSKLVSFTRKGFQSVPRLRISCAAKCSTFHGIQKKIQPIKSKAFEKSNFKKKNSRNILFSTVGYKFLCSINSFKNTSATGSQLAKFLRREKKMDSTVSSTSSPLLNASRTPLVRVVDYRNRLITSRSTTGCWISASNIISVEVAERFAYYGIASNLIMFLTGQLKESTADAAAAVNALSEISASMSLIGGFAADSYLGRHRTIVISSMIYVLAKPDTVEKVCEIVKKQLALDDKITVTGESKFSELGADSLDTVEIVMGLEEAFGISVEEDGAQSIATVQDAADMIEKLVEAQ